MKIGIVHYVNSRPLAWGLLHQPLAAGIDPILLPPAKVADGLASGALDVGLVPSIELARIPGLVVVPDLAIAATHEVRSVLLVSRVPVGEIRSVALDENSRTSAALVRLLLTGLYGLSPRYASAAPRLDQMLERADAALVIGDPALHVDRERHVVLDLAGEWLEWTGLPFVFAVWAARAEAAGPELVGVLERSFEEGWSALDSIVGEASEETGLAPAILRDYYTRNLRYRIGAAEQAGLAEYLRRCAAAGLCEPAALEFLPAAPRSAG